MFLADNIAGRIIRDNEALFDGEIRLTDDEQGSLVRISSCHIYELNYKINRMPDTLKIVLEYILELGYVYACKNGEKKSGIRKLSARHDVLAERNEIPQSDVDADYSVIPSLRSADFYYSIDDEARSVNLTIMAKLEFIISRSFYNNIYECARKHDPELMVEPVDWMSVLENVNIDDIVAVLENFARLLKIRNTFDKRNQPVGTEDGVMTAEFEKTNKILIKTNRSLESQLKEARDSLAGLRREINERNDIVEKLLALLEKSRLNHDPGIP